MYSLRPKIFTFLGLRTQTKIDAEWRFYPYKILSSHSFFNLSHQLQQCRLKKPKNMTAGRVMRPLAASRWADGASFDFFLFTLFWVFFFILIRHARAVRLQSVTYGWLSSLYGHANLGKSTRHGEGVMSFAVLDQAWPQTHHTCRSKFNSLPSSMIAAWRQAPAHSCHWFISRWLLRCWVVRCALGMIQRIVDIGSRWSL
jgi:hypothetical protein